VEKEKGRKESIKGEEKRYLHVSDDTGVKNQNSKG
jgi:hypothetical protein